jgi:hypothetical protein
MKVDLKLGTYWKCSTWLIGKFVFMTYDLSVFNVAELLSLCRAENVVFPVLCLILGAQQVCKIPLKIHAVIILNTTTHNFYSTL